MGSKAAGEQQEVHEVVGEQQSCGQGSEGRDSTGLIRFIFFVVHAHKPKATTEKVLKMLSEENKDVRKAEWTNKEVCSIPPTCPKRRSPAFQVDVWNAHPFNSGRHFRSQSQCFFVQPGFLMGA